MKKVTAVLLGAGNRGSEAYASYALKHREQLEFVAVAEPNKDRRDNFAKLHDIDEQQVYETWEKLLMREKIADCILICTQDHMHYEPAILALKKGYHVLLEKPMSPSPTECIELGDAAEKYQRIFSVCHVLRYTKFFNTIKRILDEGRIGRLITVIHNEYVGYVHQSHSFVRGNWCNSEASSPMILAKSCHDMDILLYLIGAPCTKIASFGSLSHFKPDQAPLGAPKRCLQGCPSRETCIYNVEKIYLTENTDWPTSVIGEDMSLEGRYKSLETGPYGRCVYHCDNDVVDHQIVTMEFNNEVTASFTMTAFCKQNRTIQLMGTDGYIRGDMEGNVIELHDRVNDIIEKLDLGEITDGQKGHGGGDSGLMSDFVKLVASGNAYESKSSAELSVQSHLMAFAAETSRLEGRVVDMSEYLM